VPAAIIQRIEPTRTAPEQKLRPRRTLGPLRRAAVWIVPAENPTEVVYGLLGIGILLAAESGLHESYLDTELSAAIAACGYWLLHAYARVLGRRLRERERLSVDVVARALAHDRALLRGAAIPLIAVLVAWVAGASQTTGVTVALYSVVASLVLFEVLAGIRARSGPRELAVEAGVGALLGVTILVVRIVLH
jgi:hypothetical protein